MKIGIIGCGLIGKKRALSICKSDKIIYVYDIDPQKAKNLIKYTGGEIAKSQDEVLRSNADIIFIATTHNHLSEIAIKAINNGKHVLVEKPGACDSKGIKKMINAAKKRRVSIKVGFNHRFHPAILKAHEILKKERLGKILFIRGRYGHGGRIGYEKEWRCNKKISGGGELLDQGSHLIDLALWFMGDLKVDYKLLPTYFWDTKVEDNCFIALKNKSNNIAWLHASWTEWKNCFSFEIYTKKAKLMITGLGGSYGTEKLHLFKMLSSMGPPKVKEWKFDEQDTSWEKEFLNFKKSINKSSGLIGSAEDSLKVMKLIENIYNK